MQGGPSSQGNDLANLLLVLPHTRRELQQNIQPKYHVESPRRTLSSAIRALLHRSKTQKVCMVQQLAQRRPPRRVSPRHASQEINELIAIAGCEARELQSLPLRHAVISLPGAGQHRISVRERLRPGEMIPPRLALQPLRRWRAPELAAGGKVMRILGES
jgi:hypothetical protein